MTTPSDSPQYWVPTDQINPANQNPSSSVVLLPLAAISVALSLVLMIGSAALGTDETQLRSATVSAPTSTTNSSAPATPVAPTEQETAIPTELVELLPAGVAVMGSSCISTNHLEQVFEIPGQQPRCAIQGFPQKVGAAYYIESAELVDKLRTPMADRYQLLPMPVTPAPGHDIAVYRRTTSNYESAIGLYIIDINTDNRALVYSFIGDAESRTIADFLLKNDLAENYV